MVYVGIWVWYDMASKKASEAGFKNWFNHEYLDSNYSGSIGDIGNAGVNDCYLYLTIYSITDSGNNMISYNVYSCKGDSFRDFIQIGDSVIKKHNDSALIIINQNKIRKRFIPNMQSGNIQHIKKR